jgi:threonine synthase
MLKNGEIKNGEKVNIVVPTGNFGNILASYYAYKMGLPVNKFICASNENNVLTDFINTGVYNKNRDFLTTISPAMDILISSNLERLIFDACGEDCDKVADWMHELAATGCYEADTKTMDNINQHFWGSFATEAETTATIADVYEKYGYLVDPHTAVGIKVYRDYIAKTGDTSKTVCVSTASPFKFNTAVAEAIYGRDAIDGMTEFETLEFLSQKTGQPIPTPLKDLDKRTVRFTDVCEKEDMKKKVEEFIYD